MGSSVVRVLDQAGVQLAWLEAVTTTVGMASLDQTGSFIARTDQVIG